LSEELSEDSSGELALPMIRSLCTGIRAKREYARGARPLRCR
jgi:hypothetical protein